MSTTAQLSEEEPASVDLPDAVHDAEELKTSTPGLAEGVAILLLMSVLQRGVGFVRGVLFCRWLDPVDLGQWDMLRGFVFLAVPLAALGIPGSFSRYIEYYRRRGQLGRFLSQTTIVYIVTSTLLVFGVWSNADWVSIWLFGSPDYASVVSLGVIAILAVAVQNLLIDLFSGLRDFRAVSLLQFYGGILFAAVGVSAMLFWEATVSAVVVAFALSTIGSCLLLSRRLFRTCQSISNESVESISIWRKLAPYAAAIWATNLLSNSFDVVDRYMLVHLSSLGSDAALTLVGDYHASRIIPLLMVAVATMISQVATPHLSCDWESGRRDYVSQRLGLMLKLTAMALTIGGALTLAISPLLFRVAFEGKYSTGLSIMPYTLVYCIWGGLILIVSIYLWCSEKAHLSSISFLIGFLVNVVLNALLVPHYALWGAVVATSISHLLVLSLVAWLARWLGWRTDKSVWVSLLLPGLLLSGPWICLAVCAAVSLLAWHTPWMLNVGEKKQITDAMKMGREKLTRLFIQPA